MTFSVFNFFKHEDHIPAKKFWIVLHCGSIIAALIKIDQYIWFCSHLIQLELSHQIEAVYFLPFLRLQHLCFCTFSLVPNVMDVDMILMAVNFDQDCTCVLNRPHFLLLFNWNIKYFPALAKISLYSSICPTSFERWQLCKWKLISFLHYKSFEEQSTVSRNFPHSEVANEHFYTL